MSNNRNSSKISYTKQQKKMKLKMKKSFQFNYIPLALPNIYIFCKLIPTKPLLDILPKNNIPLLVIINTWITWLSNIIGI